MSNHQHAMTTLQWSSHVEIEKDGETVYLDGLDFEPTKELKERIEHEWQDFENKARALGFDPEIHRTASYDPSQGTIWDHVAHDWTLTRQRTGVGFWDTGRYVPAMGKKLTDLAHTYSELYVFVDENGNLEAD
tara:strand:- start:83 stop:481 length:399 start_codon:yes stop_codon:yes gene_type:complete